MVVVANDNVVKLLLDNSALDGSSFGGLFLLLSQLCHVEVVVLITVVKLLPLLVFGATKVARLDVVVAPRRIRSDASAPRPRSGIHP